LFTYAAEFWVTGFGSVVNTGLMLRNRLSCSTYGSNVVIQVNRLPMAVGPTVPTGNWFEAEW